MSEKARRCLELLQEARLTLHEGGDGASVDWSLSGPALLRLAEDVQDTTVSAETGCGLSTLLLGSTGSEHHCFTLLESERKRLEHTARSLNLNLDRVHFHLGDSAATVPGTDLPVLDIAVIDGGHAFPYPVTDWYFLTRSLRVGGLLAIDDAWIPSVQLLTAFLDAETEWGQVAADGRTNWYRRQEAETSVSQYPDRWDVQGINQRVARHFTVMKEFSRERGPGKLVRHPYLSCRHALAKVVSRRGPTNS